MRRSFAIFTIALLSACNRAEKKPTPVHEIYIKLGDSGIVTSDGTIASSQMSPTNFFRCAVFGIGQRFICTKGSVEVRPPSTG